MEVRERMVGVCMGWGIGMGNEPFCRIVNTVGGREYLVGLELGSIILLLKQKEAELVCRVIYSKCMYIL